VFKVGLERATGFGPLLHGQVHQYLPTNHHRSSVRAGSGRCTSLMKERGKISRNVFNGQPWQGSGRMTAVSYEECRSFAVRAYSDAIGCCGLITRPICRIPVV
jgi:hypothetical protein